MNNHFKIMYDLDDRIFVDKLRASTTFIMRVRAKNEVGLGEPYSITVVTENVSKLLLFGVLSLK